MVLKYLNQIYKDPDEIIQHKYVEATEVRGDVGRSRDATGREQKAKAMREGGRRERNI